MVAHVFLSAVSSEFGAARDALADALQAHDMTVRVQRSFRYDPGAETLLHQLANYIQHCDAVVCLIGTRSVGGFPEQDEAAPFVARGILPPGIVAASYTQWEFFLARHFKRRCLVYFATDKFTAEAACPKEDRHDLQAAFAAHVKSLGLRAPRVDSAGDFRAEVLKDILQPGPGTSRPDQPIVLPYPSLGTLFKGRAGFLARLRSSLTRPDGGAAAIAGRAVHGLGGVGKTRAAVEYAWAHQTDYTALLLLDAETGEKLQTGLAALVGPLRLEAAQAATDEKAQMEAAVAWLNANPGWFLILDNIDTEPALTAAHRLLGRLSGGHVVLTSRLAAFPRGVERLDLDVLALDDAAAFLLEATETGRRRADDDAAQARVLAEELGQLALALEMAAATIEARRFSFAQYRAVWQGNRARVVGWADQKITGYHHAVAETWQTSVDQLGAPGRRLLERLAFLAPDPVPMALLDVPVPGAKAEDAVAALDDLATYSLATRDAEGEAFLVHRLVQDVTRRGLEEAGSATARLTEALGWANAAFSGDPQDVRDWPRLDPLTPHADAVAARADAAGITDPTGRLMGELGMLFQAKALYARVEPLMRRALAIDEARLGKDHPTVAIRLNDLAQLLQDTNRLGEAEPLMRRVVEIFEANLGKVHPNVATALNNLAGLLQDTNRLGEAEPLMRRALAIDEASVGKDHPNVARDLNNLALLLQDTNRLGEVEPLMRRALAIDEASFSKDHPNVARDLNNLAGLLQATNRLGEAEPLMRRALAITEASFGKDHPSVATDLNNLAALLQATNRLGEAEPLMRRALAVTEASLGKDHPTVAISLSNLAQLLQDTNRLGEAEAPMRRALAIVEASFGKDHPNVAVDLNNLAALLQATNRLGEAEPLMRRALAIDEASLGKDHPEVATNLNNLAMLLQATNRLGEAEPPMRRHLAIFLAFQRDTGHTHPHRDAAIANYADLLAAMGKSEADIAATIAALFREAGLDQG